MGASCSIPQKVEGDQEASVLFDTSKSSIPSTPQSKVASPFSSVDPRELSIILSAPLNSSLSLEWKSAQRGPTSLVPRLEEINVAANELLGAARGMIVLFDTTKVYFRVRTGVFSPALDRKGDFHELLKPILPEDLHKTLAVCPDTLADEFLRHNPGVVGRPYWRAFAGAPLLSRGNHWLGMLGVLDFVAREPPTEAQAQRLHALAAQAVTTLQQDMLEALGGSSASIKDVELPAVWIDVSKPDWPVVGANASWEKLTGVSLADLVSVGGLLAAMTPADCEELAALHAAVAEASAADSSCKASLPAILNPVATSAASLQFLFALKPAATFPPPPPPTPHSLSHLYASSSAPLKREVWVAEVHVRLQPSTGPPSGAYSSQAAAAAAAAVDLSHGPDPAGILRSSDPHRHLWSSNSSVMNSGSGSGSQGSSARRSFGVSTTGSGQAPAAPPLVPPRLASLQLGRALGMGSYGRVYSGLLRGSAVAVKIIEASGEEAGKLRHCAQFEAIIALKVDHPNIVATLDWCALEPNEIWIVQELCDLGTLSAAISQRTLRPRELNGIVDLQTVLETALDVARGMRYLHYTQNLVHADLSANNVMLATASSKESYRGFTAKCSDLGLSRLGRGDFDFTKTVGTVSCMAPEMIMDGIMAKSGDVWSFGCILWEMYCGKRAWAELSEPQVIFVVTCKGDRLKLPEGAPASYAALTDQCMVTDPSQRPTFNDIVPRLEAMLEKFELKGF